MESSPNESNKRGEDNSMGKRKRVHQRRDSHWASRRFFRWRNENKHELSLLSVDNLMFTFLSFVQRIASRRWFLLSFPFFSFPLFVCWPPGNRNAIKRFPEARRQTNRKEKEKITGTQRPPAVDKWKDDQSRHPGVKRIAKTSDFY